MVVPTYDEMKIHLLRLAGDEREHTLRTAAEHVADVLNVVDEDLKILVPSGVQTRFDNRISWACTYLKKAGLLESSGRGRFRITNRGKSVLEEGTVTLDNNYLMRFPEFAEFKQGRGRTSDNQVTADTSEDTEETPEELLAARYQDLRDTLANDLLETVLKCSPRFFENLVVELLVALGYGGSREDAGKAIGRSGDEGIDGMIKEDRLGLDVVYIQAKRWQNTVGRPTVQAFAGSLEGKRARKGILLEAVS